ncbi:FAD-dependent oxidoreductase [Novosphingobium sp.]|uniref:NAD(P)/FAD-dependent oxidoreductase n=1 Tax=Novosphingobium sp. TaxID=1874826 RepID=UPI00262898F8|nr:FAD-dependent oxidoreductase [Novosphingobium sp.]
MKSVNDIAAVGTPGPDEIVVIVGAGIAGVRCALALREAGFAGAVKLLNAEEHFPYDRPPLSKGVLTGEQSIARIALAKPEELKEAGIELISNARCTRVDLAKHQVELANGDIICWDRLVLATGSAVRTLPDLPQGAPGVHYLRTLDDAKRLRARIEMVKAVAVVGAGVIGLEVAASLTALGVAVTVIDPAPRVMSRSASAPLGDLLLARHKAAGVSFHLGTTANSIKREENGFVFTLSDGSELSADDVVVGVGVTPCCDLATGCGIAADKGGILTDEHGRTSDPMVYAAGEVAYHVNVGLGRYDRQETWAHAASHGEHVGYAIMGRDVGYAELSSYWTDQYDLAIQVIGVPSGEVDIVNGDLFADGGLVFHMIDGAVGGVTSVNAVRKLRTARKLIGRTIDPAVLADARTDFKQLA